MVHRSPAWPLMIGNRPSGQTSSWAVWLQGCRMGHWAIAHIKWLTQPKLQQLLQECNHLKLRWGILYSKTSAKGIPEGSISIHLASHTSGRLLWEDAMIKPLRPQKNAWPDAWSISCGLKWLYRWRTRLRSATSASPSRQSNKGLPMEDIMATHPLELRAHQLPMPEARYRERKRHVLVVMDHFTPTMPRHTPLNPRQPRQWPRPSVKISSSITGLTEIESFGTRGGILRVTSLPTSANWPGPRNLGPAHINHRQMAQCERFNFTLITMLCMLPPWVHGQTGKAVLEC